jgi:hypothetical protein
MSVDHGLAVKIARVALIAVAFSLVTGNSIARAEAEDGPLGLGVIVGEPSGITAKLWAGDNMAFVAAAAYAFRDETALQLQGDLIWHFDDRPEQDENDLTATFGFGFRFKFGDDQELSGLRFPIGVNYELPGSSLEVFGEVVPVLEFLGDEDLGLNLGGGVRYYFD